jgi:5-bromo-4-chloroindolyl phosphate hydrolysis protein
MTLSRGTAILLAALAAAAVMPAAAIGLHLPLWLDLGLSGGTFAGGFLLLRSGKQETLDADELADARNQTARGLIPDAAAALDRMKKAMTQIKDPAVRGQVDGLVRTGTKVLGDVRTDPSRAMAVRRLLTFYLPNAASIAEGWVALESRATPSPERMAQTGATLRSLNEAFAKFSDDMVEPQMQTLDIDLKVVNDALRSDLEKTA